MTRPVSRPVSRLAALAPLAVILALTPIAAPAETRVPSDLAQVQLSFAPVVERAAPAVVNIYASRTVTVSSPLFDDPFFSQFFRDLGPAREQRQNSLGSGVILPGGLVVSNYHVVANATDIRVVLADRREYDGTLVLADQEADLAVIRLDGAGDLPALDLADSDALAVGDLVLAIGNPFGVGQTVSSGIISGLARSGTGGGAFNDQSYFIQTDAPINPGNSGGALVDMQGRLIGINTQIVTSSGGSNGIGFAIPANLVAAFVAQAEAGATAFARPWAGLDLQLVDADIAAALGLDRPQGLLVQRLAETSPFAAAGVEPGDVILALDGHPVNAPAELSFRLSLQTLGTNLPVTLLRDGERLTVAVEMRAATSNAEAVGSEPYTVTTSGPFKGLVVQQVTPALAAQWGLQLSTDTEGVMIVGAEDAPAARNFRGGDVITEINGMTIRSMEDFLSAASADTRTWRVLIDRRGGRVFLTWRG